MTGGHLVFAAAAPPPPPPPLSEIACLWPPCPKLPSYGSKRRG